MKEDDIVITNLFIGELLPGRARRHVDLYDNESSLEWGKEGLDTSRRSLSPISLSFSDLG